MTGKTPEPAPEHHAAHHRMAFFRQSGWMMIAATVGGGFMYIVHMVAKQMPKGEYGVFTTLLQVISLMAIPAAGLQMIFAQQVAAAITEEQQRMAISTFRIVLRGIFFIWIIMAVTVAIFWKQALAGLQISNPAALAATVGVGLAAMMMPIVLGMMQGRQNFLWLGWAAIFNGAGRFIVICVVVVLLHGWAAGAMSAVFLGMTGGVMIGAWQIRDVWRTTLVKVAWGEWLRRAVPLTLGFGVATFMLSADMIFAQNFFPRDQTAYYAAAGMIGRALVFFTQPLTAVMFPKIAHSTARSQKTDVLALTLGVTALAGAAVAIGCTLFPSLPLRIVYDKSFLAVATPLVPWFAWSMLPLTLSNVLINSLMARARFAAVPWLVLVAIGYGVALAMVGRHAGKLADTGAGLRMMIQTLGVFNLVLFLVCAWFTWVVKDKTKTTAANLPVSV
jgi:O-antigen/teichoic acid export membrane protein